MARLSLPGLIVCARRGTSSAALAAWYGNEIEGARPEREYRYRRPSDCSFAAAPGRGLASAEPLQHATCPFSVRLRTFL
jgi:hypothetical protein